MRPTALLMLTSVSLSSLALAQDHPDASPPAATTVSAEAATVLDRTLAWYAGLPGASTVLVQKMEMPGMPAMETKTRVMVLKPNRFSITEEAGSGAAMCMMAPELVSDGTTLWQSMPAMQMWSQSVAPKTLDVGETPALEMAGPATFVLEMLAPNAGPTRQHRMRPVYQ